MCDSASKSFQSACLVLIHDCAVREDRPGSQQAEALVEVAFGLELREELPRGFDSLLGFVEVRLNSDVPVGSGDLTKATEELRATAYSKSWIQYWLHQSSSSMVFQSADVVDTSHGLVQGYLCKLVSDRIRRIAIHVTLAYQRALSFRQAYIGKNACCLSMARTVV